MPLTLIFYEAPHRIKETMDVLIQSLGDRNAVTARELTKKFETFERGTLAELRSGMNENDPRGEYVILVEGWNESMEKEDEEETSWQDAAVTLAEGMPLKELHAKSPAATMFREERFTSIF